MLEKDADILARFLGPARFGIFPVPGRGRHYLPWIHIADLCRIYLRALTDEEMKGPYNAVSPGHATLREFVNALSEASGKRGLKIPVPAIILKITLGNMADMVLKGSRVSGEKIKNAGLIFQYPNLETALSGTI